MTLARKLFGLVALAGSAAPAAAQYTPPRPAPQGPTRLVFVAPPWITHGPRAVSPGMMTPPQAIEVQTVPAVMPPQVAEPPVLPSMVRPTGVVPAVPATPPAPPRVTPAAATATRPVPTPAVRPDTWRPGTTTTPGTVVPASPRSPMPTPSRKS